VILNFEEKRKQKRESSKQNDKTTQLKKEDRKLKIEH